MKARLRHFSVSLFTAVAAISVVLAAGTVWLILTSPVTVANAINEGDVTPFVRELANVLLNVLSGLLKYL